MPAPTYAPTPPYEPPRRTGLFVGVLVLLLALLAGGLFLFANEFGDEQGSTVAVPNVVGATEAAARASLSDAGLEATAVPVADAAIPPGQVVSTEPPAGREVEEGSSVELRISQGPETVDVPDLTGETQEDALETLTGLGLTGTPVPEESDEPEGTVIGQDPPPGPVAKGSGVRLAVSAGSGDTDVPNVRGLSVEDASARLEDAGFVVVTAEESSDEVDEGLVIRTDPPRDAVAPEGSEVTIFVSTGPPPETTTTTTTTSTTTTSTSTTTTTTPDSTTTSTTG
jgi:serine/threonine-protein kinase